VVVVEDEEAEAGESGLFVKTSKRTLVGLVAVVEDDLGGHLGGGEKGAGETMTKTCWVASVVMVSTYIKHSHEVRDLG
jgi:hypothetical protein